MDLNMARTLYWLRCRAKVKEEDAHWGERMYHKGILPLHECLAREAEAEEAWDEYHAAVESVSDEAR